VILPYLATAAKRFRSDTFMTINKSDGLYLKESFQKMGRRFYSPTCWVQPGVPN
jgi:hypothetical protein